MRRGKGQNAERRPSRFHSLASLCNNNYSRRLPAARNNLAQWKSSPQTRQRFRSIALSRPQSSCIITRGFHDCWFHSITVNTNDCRYHCARLLNARQNQNGRGERERGSYRAIACYKLETISRVYTNCFRPEYRPSPLYLVTNIETQFRPTIVQQMTRQLFIFYFIFPLRIGDRSSNDLFEKSQKILSRFEYETK